VVTLTLPLSLGKEKGEATAGHEAARTIELALIRKAGTQENLEVDRLAAASR